MKQESCYKIGLVAKPHGLKGEVTVLLDDAPVDWDTVETIFLQTTPGQLVPYFIEEISVRDTKAYVKFEEVDSPEDAKAISKLEMYLPKTDRPKAGKNEFYDDEIIGFLVTDDTHGDLGTVEGVEVAGPSKLLVVKKQGKEILIPVQGPFITKIAKTKKQISVTLPEGFLDI